MSFVHTPVLYQQALAGLAIKADGCYVDATYGRGGHSAGILQQLGPSGQLWVFDRDPQAVAHAKAQLGDDSRVHIQLGCFSELSLWLEKAELMGKVQGVLVDFGVSSPQLEEANRGFSLMHDGPLDMRMNPTQGQSAAQWLASVDEQTLADTLYHFGGERYSRRIAKAVISARHQQPLLRTAQLAEIIKKAHPRWPRDEHPATKSFQAIRIFINDELAEIEKFLPQATDALAIDGRLVTISFHSGEDQLVKRFIQVRPQAHPLLDFLPPQQVKQRLKLVGKAIKPSADEIQRNRRARSAVMRVAQKIA